MGKIYYIHMTENTCCDYWDMKLLTYGVTEMDARMNARQKFIETYGAPPDYIDSSISFDKSEMGLNFVGIISKDNGSK